jgi:2-polyprenyl-3-methyl-5-hydroxy-6-metoxy-1,4-benzoquinol methylase
MVSNQKNCRICRRPLHRTFIDLGVSPLSNSFLRPEQLDRMEPFYPLHVFVCESCFLVQLEEFESPASIFTDYAYFSSFSTDWLAHARSFSEMAISRFGLTPASNVVEIASNDGYLLQYFLAEGMRVLGVEPAKNVAAVAVERGIATRTIFFGRETSRELLAEGHAADLLIGNNVFAHVPDLHSFVAGLATLLKPEGVITLEFPHLLQLIHQNQFDTIYHEHFSYLSLLAAERILGEHGLMVFDVEELPTHGGSLRIYGKHGGDGSKVVCPRVLEIRRKEIDAGLHALEGYASFGERAAQVKCDLLSFLIEQKRTNKTVAGYGAPAKGNTLLNYCGIGPELLPYTVDRSPHKQGLFLPGSRIPIASPERILETRPDYVLILPWNLRNEISSQMAAIRAWGGRFIVPIPRLEVF